jgi:hypothetical protein
MGVANQETIGLHIETLCGRRWRVQREYRQPTGSNSGNGGRPSAKQIQLNKQIIARDAKDILAIVEAAHGDFNAVNAATAPSTRSGSPWTPSATQPAPSSPFSQSCPFRGSSRTTEVCGPAARYPLLSR